MTYYYLALAFGGTLLAASLLLGGDDGGGADSADGPGGHAHIGAAAWVPATSLQFWAFALTFFGLAGVVLTKIAGAGPTVTALVSVACGYGAGVGATWAVRKAMQDNVSSATTSDDFVGMAGAVTVAIPEAGQSGKVRIDVRGRTHDLIATSEAGEHDVGALPVGTAIVVVAVGEDGRVRVARLDLVPSESVT